MVSAVCEWRECGRRFEMATGAYNRARGRGSRVFCGRACAGLARRVYLSTAERKAKKAAYDVEYRAKNRDKLIKQARDWYAAWGPANRDKEKAKRDANKDRHAEYIRSDRYRAWKHSYDQRRMASRYGDFGEAWQLIKKLDRAVRAKASRYEIYVAKGYYNKAQQRKREYARSQSTSLTR